MFAMLHQDDAIRYMPWFDNLFASVFLLLLLLLLLLFKGIYMPIVTLWTLPGNQLAEIFKCWHLKILKIKQFTNFRKLVNCLIKQHSQKQITVSSAKHIARKSQCKWILNLLRLASKGHSLHKLPWFALYYIVLHIFYLGFSGGLNFKDILQI